MIDDRHMKKLFLWMLLAAGCMSVMAQQRVKISGQVTDFDGKPVSHCAVMLMTINPRYHRLELYGTTAFCPTGTNALMVYTRPMSATEAMKYDEKLYRDNNNGVIDYSVKLEDFKVQAFVDGQEVKILRIQHMTEQYGNQKRGAFLMMLDYKVRNDDTDIHQIRITAENTKHHEKGENLC